jgi:farnesyl diphosphate synthase
LDDIIYKTTIYSFYLLSLRRARTAHLRNQCGFLVEKKNESDPDYYKLTLDILLPLGEYFQIQDDHLDFAGTPEQIGKVGTDFLDNKCSWCVNTAVRFPA